METLTIACSAAWLAVGVYVAWIAIQNAHLARRVEELRDARIETSDRDQYSKVA
jgi:CcmD family protein